VGWNVPVDRASYEKYQTVPAGPLRALIDAHILRAPQQQAASQPGIFAWINLPRSLACPFLNPERLCQIQVEHGESYLCHTCATFPRTAFTIDSLEETTLTLSCPEAARLVLTNPDLSKAGSKEEYTVTWNKAAKSPLALRSYFWAIREFTVTLIRNRAYPLWQRMFLLGTFSRRLEALVHGEFERGFPALLSDFSAAVASGSLRAKIETIPADLALQLTMVMEMVKLRMEAVASSPRLAETLNAFLQGIEQSNPTTLEGQCAEYAAAYERFYAPFFAKYPHVMENLLINMILRKLFPFGVKLFDLKAAQEPAKEFALLATEFALLKGLLIGVAGCHREAFSIEHVVQTVQIATKHFEHNTGFLPKAHGLLTDRKLDNAQGLTMLLRN
jgi:lysine-N-methylase